MLLGQHPKSSAVKRGTLLPPEFSIPSLVLIALGTCYLQFLQDAILHLAGCLCIGSILSRCVRKFLPAPVWVRIPAGLQLTGSQIVCHTIRIESFLSHSQNWGRFYHFLYILVWRRITRGPLVHVSCLRFLQGKEPSPLFGDNFISHHWSHWLGQGRCSSVLNEWIYSHMELTFSYTIWLYQSLMTKKTD